MKKQRLFRTSLALLSIVMLSSCSQDIFEEGGTRLDDGSIIVINAAVEEAIDEETATRAVNENIPFMRVADLPPFMCVEQEYDEVLTRAEDNINNGKFDVTSGTAASNNWSYAYVMVDDGNYNYNGYKYSVTAGSSSLTAPSTGAPTFATAKTVARMYGWYPLASTSDPSSKVFTVQTTQTNDATGKLNYQKSDIMLAGQNATGYANSTRVLATGVVTAGTLVFSHAMAKIRLRVVPADGVTVTSVTINSVSPTVTISESTVGDVTSLSLTPSGTKTNVTLLSNGNQTAATYYNAVIPPESHTGNFITVVAKKTGESTTRTITYNLSSAKEFAAKQYNITLNINQSNVDQTIRIPAWEDGGTAVSPLIPFGSITTYIGEIYGIDSDGNIPHLISDFSRFYFDYKASDGELSLLSISINTDYNLTIYGCIGTNSDGYDFSEINTIDELTKIGLYKYRIEGVRVYTGILEGYFTVVPTTLSELQLKYNSEADDNIRYRIRRACVNKYFPLHVDFNGNISVDNTGSYSEANSIGVIVSINGLDSWRDSPDIVIMANSYLEFPDEEDLPNGVSYFSTLKFSTLSLDYSHWDNYLSGDYEDEYANDVERHNEHMADQTTWHEDDYEDGEIVFNAIYACRYYTTSYSSYGFTEWFIPRILNIRRIFGSEYNLFWGVPKRANDYAYREWAKIFSSSKYFWTSTGRRSTTSSRLHQYVYKLSQSNSSLQTTRLASNRSAYIWPMCIYKAD